MESSACLKQLISHGPIHGLSLVTREGTNPFDVPSLSCRAGQAEADHVHEQTRDPQQVHCVSNEGGRNDIVHKEGSIVRKEHTPAE